MSQQANPDQAADEFEPRPYVAQDQGQLRQRSSSRVPIQSHHASPASEEPETHHAQTVPHFPYNLVMKVTTSEPRDVLQSERTCLTFIRFSTALFFTALGIMLNFKLDTSGQEPAQPDPNRRKHPIFNHSKYSKAASFMLLILALFVLVLSAVNYFITVNRYARHKIATYNFNNLTTMACMTGIVFTLGVINITMLIEGYVRER
ncbi:uncharacterized protein LODBEIA_P16740 [Lodderomyces beijingensis]|uniref:DUF202 domain-containing protein n=1 Tax=Lodderomyces beijingensis TaxID=1775926 RepID=A0ABP0ZH12_9ASCO